MVSYPWRVTSGPEERELTYINIQTISQKNEQFSKVLHRTPMRICPAAGFFPSLRRLSSNAPSSKYSEKLRWKAEESDANWSLPWLISSNSIIRRGLSVSQLIEEAKAGELERHRSEAKKLKDATPTLPKAPLPSTEFKKIPPLPVALRNDAPPFKVRPISSLS